MALKTRGWPRFSRDIYNDDIVSEMLKSKLVIIMEDVSVMYRTSLWCKTSPYYYYMGFENFRQLPAMIVLGEHNISSDLQNSNYVLSTLLVRLSYRLVER